MLYSVTQASRAVWASCREGNVRSARNSLRRLWWNRSILPVVVGERTPVWRCEIPFSRQIRSNSTSTGWGPNRPVKTLPFVGQDLIGDPVASERLREHGTHGLGDRSRDQAGGHAEPAVVIDAGDDLELGAVVQLDPAHHVHLPQLHRALALPPTELVSALAATAQLDQAVALEAPVDRRERGDGVNAESGELVADPPRSPPRMLPTEFADLCLDLGGDLVRTGLRTMRSVGKRWQAALLVAGDPCVHRLAGDAKPLGDLGGLPSVLHDRQDGLVPLLHDRQFHQHGPPPDRDGRCQASAEATVKDQPNTVSSISRTRVKHQVTPERPASPGTRQVAAPGVGLEPTTYGLTVRRSAN